MQEKVSFGALLKRYRLAVGLSQEALAARASLGYGKDSFLRQPFRQ